MKKWLSIFVLLLVLPGIGRTQSENTAILAYHSTEGLILWDVSQNLRSDPLPDSQYVNYFSWSRDGRYLSYYGYEPLSGAESGLQLVDTQTSAVTLIDAHPENAPHFYLRDFWSANGEVYYYYTHAGLFSTPLMDIHPTPVLRGESVLVSHFSPDGNFGVLHADAGTFLMETNTGALSPLRDRISDAIWPDDNRIIYMVETGTVAAFYAYEIGEQTGHLLFEIDDANQSRITGWHEGELELLVYDTSSGTYQYNVWDGEVISTVDAPPDYSPDRQFAVRSDMNGFELWAQNTWQTIDDASRVEWSWSPTSTHLAYGTRQQVTIYAVNSGERQTYTDLCTGTSCGFEVDYYNCGDWSPDGRWLICHANGFRQGNRASFLVDTHLETLTPIPDVVINYRVGSFLWQPHHP